MDESEREGPCLQLPCETSVILTEENLCSVLTLQEAGHQQPQQRL